MSIRITDSYMANLLVRDNHRSLARMLRQQRMASSLRRVNSYADDPVAVGAINRYRSLIAVNGQYLRNVDRAHAFLMATDTALQDITGLLTDARVIAVRESSAQATTETQDQAASEVSSLIDQMLMMLNITVEGDYIFGGHRTNVEPFIRSGDVISYQGDGGLIDVQIGPQATLIVNTPGDQFLGSNSSILTGTVDMAPALNLADNLGDLNLGGGWEEGAFTITDGNGTTYDVDLGGVANVGDVINRIDAATGGAVTASISPGGQSLQLAGSGPITVADVDDGHTAQSLGLSGHSAADLLVGRDIRTAPTSATLLADIPSLNGSLPLGMINISSEGNDVLMSFFPAATIGDLQTILNAAVPTLQFRIEGAVLSIVSGSTDHFVISNADGTNTASVLGIEGTGTPTRLFGVLADLKAALELHDPVAIRSTLAELATVKSNVLGETIKVGGRQNNLDWMGTLLRRRDERLQSGLSREWDADIAQVASDLNQAQLAYEASLLVTSRLFETNLMQYLR